MVTALTFSLNAQSLKPLSMAQLTPGNPDYLKVKTLQNTRWTADSKFSYTLPDDASASTSASKALKGVASADGLWRAESRGDRLFLVRYADGVTTADNDPKPVEELEISDPDLTYSDVEGQSDVVWGQSVHRNEFGIDGGLFWSPSGHRLAFYRMDQSMVQSYPLVQTDDREATVKWMKYPMAGMTSHQVTLGIYDPDNQKTVYLKTDKRMADPEHYLTCVTWRPDGKQIFVAELNRAQNYMELNVYDAATGDYLTTLFTEKDERYVEPENALYFLPGSNDRFIWQSERDGWNHLYLCDLAGVRYDAESGSNLIPRQLTRGEWVVTRLVGADPLARNLFFMSTKDSPMQSNLYKVNLKSLEVRRLTTEDGVHAITMSPDYKQFYDAYSGPAVPRVCQTVNVRSGKKTVLYTAADPYEGYARPEVEVGTLKAADGVTDLYYRLVKPIGFDPSKKYPTVVYLYNGPHAQLVTGGYQYGLPGWDCYMAGLGYVVFTVDGRGSANRGLAFEQAIWHNLGENESKDQMQGVALLKTKPYVDADRMGIYGWSYGGFMATYMMLHYPETFKVGVCGGPVLDWSRYEVMYGERYMGTPQNNAEAYERNAMINHADKLKGRLLIIHDDQDATVVPQMSMQFLKGAVNAGTYPDFMMYANHGHNVRGVDRVHLLTLIARYFEDHLK